VRKMMRIPRGISPASGRGAVSGLSCPQKKMFSAVRTDFFNTGLASPPSNLVPTGYFTQIGNTAAAEQRANCLYATPHGPEPKPTRISSGRLPVSLFPSTLQFLLLPYECACMLPVSCPSSIMRCTKTLLQSQCEIHVLQHKKLPGRVWPRQGVLFVSYHHF